MRREILLLLLMSVLAALFCLRVSAQLLQVIFPVGWIPAFEDWHSGVLPYPVLLASQLCIIGLMSYALNKVRNRTVRPRVWKYRLCFVFGGAYFVFMAIRLIAGLTFLAENAWFSRPLPAFFHLVIASFILLLGRHIRTRRHDPKIFSSSTRH